MLWVIGLLTSLLTAIYMFRVVFLAFYGEPATQVAPAHPEEEEQPHRHLHDAPPAMAFALICLAVGSVIAGYAGLPAVLGGSDWFGRFLEPSFHVDAAHEAAAGGTEMSLMILSSGVAVAGIGIAMYFFLRRKTAAATMAARFAGLYRVLVNKYYVEEIYDTAIVQPIRIVSTEGLWKIVDARLIDGSVNGVGRIVSGGSGILRRAQTGSVRAYAASLFLGVVAILGYYLWR